MVIDSFVCWHDNERNEINIPYQSPRLGSKDN